MPPRALNVRCYRCYARFSRARCLTPIPDADVQLLCYCADSRDVQRSFYCYSCYERPLLIFQRSTSKKASMQTSKQTSKENGLRICPVCDVDEVCSFPFADLNDLREEEAERKLEERREIARRRLERQRRQRGIQSQPDPT